MTNKIKNNLGTEFNKYKPTLNQLISDAENKFIKQRDGWLTQGKSASRFKIIKMKGKYINKECVEFNIYSDITLLHFKIDTPNLGYYPFVRLSNKHSNKSNHFFFMIKEAYLTDKKLILTVYDFVKDNNNNKLKLSTQKFFKISIECNLKDSGVCNKIITQLNQKIKERDLKKIFFKPI